MPVHSFDALDRSEKMPGYLGAFLHGENMTVTSWKVEAGASFPEHSHPHEQISIVVAGEFELTIDGTTEPLIPSAEDHYAVLSIWEGRYASSQQRLLPCTTSL
ncbi:mannose-6-phosphate isomerase-like protein (cupin superfamily), partial [Salinibacter ruber]|uniref:cupin domain-containing protein n=1 Tax=Salinibacter ruber TaxID=146919 RepID=UPI002166E0D0